MPPTVILDAQEHLEITLVAPRGNFLVKKFRAILPRHHCFMARFLFPSGVPLTGPPSQGPPCRAPPLERSEQAGAGQRKQRLASGFYARPGARLLCFRLAGLDFNLIWVDLASGFHLLRL